MNSKKSFQSNNKQNQISDFSESITKGRKFTETHPTQKDVRHGTNLMPGNKVLNQRLNRTSVISVNKKPTLKLDDLYIIHDQKIAPVGNQRSNPTNIILNATERTHPTHPQLLVIQTKNEQKIHVVQPTKNTQQVERENQPAPAQQQTITQNIILSPTNKIKKILQPIKPATLKQINQQHHDGSAQPIYKQLSLVDQFKENSLDRRPDRIIQTTNNCLISNNFQIFQTCSHVMKQIRKDYTMNHVFNKHKSCMFSEPVHFELPKTKDEVLYCEKVSRLFCSEYKIYLEKHGARHQLGTLKSNFTGSIYNFYPVNTDIIYFSILFDKVHDSNDDIRYTEIYINQFIGAKNDHLVDQMFIPYKKMESLEGLYKVNSAQSNESKTAKIFKFSTKIPGWSQEHRCYNLDFGINKGKIMASVKNAIFIDENEKQVLKFYKSSHLTYNVTFQHPFSWIVAYGYALATTDFKIATQ